MTTKETRGRPRGFGEAPKKYKDRFQKFYFKNRERLNDERRETYQARRNAGACVRCGSLKEVKGVFCATHAKTKTTSDDA